MGNLLRSPSHARYSPRNRGQAAVLVAMAFVGLLVAVGLAVDGGILFLHRTWLREATDAAALAGAHELPNEAAACARVVEYLRNHDYTPGDGFEFRVIFPENNEVDSFPSIPSDPARVLESPSIADCSGLSYANEHQEVWVTADQQVQTVFMGLVGLNQVGTGIPAVALKPEAFDIVFVIPNMPATRHDTCDYDNPGTYTQGGDFFGNSYACTTAYESISEVNVLKNGDFEDDLDADGFPDEWQSSDPDQVSLSDEGLDTSMGAILTNSSLSGGGRADIYQTITTDQDYLYLGLWVEGSPGSLQIMESGTPSQWDSLGISIRWDTDGDSVVDTGGMFPRIVQYCEWYDGSEEPCTICPESDAEYDDRMTGVLSPTQCSAFFPPSYDTTGWQYVVIELPSDSWRRPGNDTIEIRLINYGDDDDALEGFGTWEDNVLIDELVLYSVPPKQGPTAIYIMGDSDGRASCYNPDFWPNCDDSYTTGSEPPPPSYGPNFTSPHTDSIPDILFPARQLMQQPLYDMLLAIGNDGTTNPGPPSFMEMLGEGQSFGYVLYRQSTYLIGGDCPPYSNLETSYSAFRDVLFNTISSHSWDMPGCAGGGGLGSNIAQGIAGARKILNTGSRENTTKVIILYSISGANTLCGLHQDTYCYSQSLCSPGADDYEDCIAAAEEDAEIQIQYAINDGITVFTLGVGQYANMDLMQRLAEPTGGTWHHVTDNSQLSATFQQVHDDMQQIVRLTR